MWTDERVEELKRLWNAGYSASQCANALGNCTRNAVISKVHRMGMSRSRATVRRTNIVRTGLQRRGLSKIQPSRRTQLDKNKLTVKAMLASIEKAEPPSSEATEVGKTGLEPLIKHIDNLEPHHCRWIEGKPASGWCGRRHVGPGVSWCETHARRVFDLREPVRRRVFDPVVAPATVKEDA